MQDLRNVLVTGGNGFIGSHLVERLVEKGASVRCLVRETSDLRWLQRMNLEYIRADLADVNSLEPAVAGVDTVFHVAGKTKACTEEEFHRTNAMGTMNLLQAVLRVNPDIGRFVYVSSQAAVGPSRDGRPVDESSYPRPVSPYGESKLAGEKAVLACSSQIPVTIVRPSAVYGPRDTDVYFLFRMVSRGMKPVLGWRERYGHFIYVDDFIQGLLLAGESEKAVGQTYFIASEYPITWRELGEEIARIVGMRAVVVHIPISLITTVAGVVEVVSKVMKRPSVLNREKIKELSQRFWLCDGSKAREELGFFVGCTLREGIEKSVAWYREMGWL